MVGSRGFEPRSARSERAASADCATSRRCGDHGRIRTATGQALDLLPLPVWATWPLVPPGGLEPPPHGLRARRAAFTLRREIGVERMAGLEPAPQGLEGPQATVTPHSPWFGLVSIADTQTEHGPVAFTGPGTPVSCQRSRSCELAWRKRQDSNPDPRGLEARLLPLHHAVVPLSRLDRFRDRTSP